MSSEGARQAAESVHAADLFVLRRVSAGQFVHFGGSGRGEGWAGIVEVSLADEAPLADALRTARPVRIDHDDRGLVFGPVLRARRGDRPDRARRRRRLRRARGDVDADDDALAAAAQAAVEAVEPPGRVKQLSDELELLEAVRAAATVVPPAPVDEAMLELADDRGRSALVRARVVYLADGGRLRSRARLDALVLTRRSSPTRSPSCVERGGFPHCVQDADARPLPGALGRSAASARTTCSS